ncbi:MAG: nitroreductase/quinone reductase family protein, partial [Acidimicrobiia bacterium]
RVATAARDALRYARAMTFDPDTLALLERTSEVDVETSGADGAAHRTTIWVVVDGDQAFVRSYRGANACWYREATAHPAVAIHASGRRIAATAVAAGDRKSVDRTSRALLAKYAGDPATPAMVREDVLATTLRIDPT